MEARRLTRMELSNLAILFQCLCDSSVLLILQQLLQHEVLSIADIAQNLEVSHVWVEERIKPLCIIGVIFEEHGNLRVQEMGRQGKLLRVLFPPLAST